MKSNPTGTVGFRDDVTGLTCVASLSFCHRTSATPSALKLPEPGSIESAAARFVLGVFTASAHRPTPVIADNWTP
jgi:hypothetical protein